MRSVRWREALVARCALVVVAASAACSAGPAGTLGSPDPAAVVPGRTPLWGVTVDGISHLASTVSALAALPEKPTTRVVFDVQQPARYYAVAVRRIHRVSVVMGELLDSSDEKAISVAAFRARAESYLRALGGQVSIWEIGTATGPALTRQSLPSSPLPMTP
jgi:hypothetical protein